MYGDIHFAENHDALFNGVLYRLFIADVANDGFATQALGFKFSRSLFQRWLRKVQQRDFGSLVGKAFRDRLADIAGPARHDGDLVCEAIGKYIIHPR